MILSSLTLVYPVQAYTTVTGTINQNTTWTKTGSPYNLASNVIVANGAVLTIEPGVTVNLGNYYLTINGTLNARGTGAEKIVFQKSANNTSWYSTSQVGFSLNSKGYNEQTGQGCIVENAIFYSVVLSVASSVKFSKIESDHGLWLSGGAPYVSNSRFNLQDGLNVINGAPTFVNNVLIGNGASMGVYGSGNVTLLGNSISKFGTAIKVYSGSWQIRGNNLTECVNGIELASNSKTVIEKNLINDNAEYGISEGSAVVTANTITNNKIGIHNPQAGTIISGNNILGNTINSVTATTPDVNAANNYWGTTDLAAINQTIFDYYDDATWGKVTFTPILTQPNPDAPTIPAVIYAPVITPPSTEPTQPPPTTQPTPDYTPMPTVNHGLSKTNNNQDKSLLNLNTLVVAVAVLLGAVWAVVLLGCRVKGKIRELRES
jgi:hypothetical protein